MLTARCTSGWYKVQGPDNKVIYLSYSSLSHYQITTIVNKAGFFQFLVLVFRMEGATSGHVCIWYMRTTRKTGVYLYTDTRPTDTISIAPCI